MKFNFKKIGSVLASVAMVGATAGFAAAATYPSPFVTGSTADVALVIGSGQGVASTDSLAAMEIGANLETAMSGSIGGAPTSGEFFKIERDTDYLNVGNNLTTIQTIPLTDDDLPTVLKDGTYSNGESATFGFEQKITLGHETYGPFADSNYKDKVPTIGLRFEKNNPVLNFTIDFTKSPEDDTKTNDWEDFEDTTLEILGNTYTIVDATNATRVKLTLMSGSQSDKLAYGEEATYTVDGTSYNVKLSYVDSDECQFEIDGIATQKLNKGESGKAGGLDIGVSEIFYMSGAVTEIFECKFYVGAGKIELDTNQTIEINDVKEDGMKAWIDYTISSGVNYLDKITIEWQAGEDLFVTDESSLTLPVFGGVKLTSDGLTTVAQEETVIKGGSDYVVQLETTIKSGPVSIDILSSNQSSYFNSIGGDGSDEGLATTNGTGTEALLHYRLNDSGDQYMVVTYLSGKSGSSYLVSVDCDDTDGCDFKDEVSGSSLASDKKNTTSFTIGDATIKVEYFEEDNYVNLSTQSTGSYFDRLVTEEGLEIYLPIWTRARRFSDESGNGTSTLSPWINLTGNGIPIATSTAGKTYVIYMEEEDKDGTIGSGVDVNVTVGHTSTHKVQVSGVTFVWAGEKDESYLDDPDDDNMKIGYAKSDLATQVYYDTDPDEDTAKIIYHGAQAYGGVYVAEEGAGTGETGNVVTITDAEVANAAGKNLIVVGGSCINSVAASLLGVPSGTCEGAWTIATTVGDGEYLIETFSRTGGKVATLVAGYNAADTTKAANALTTGAIDTTAGKKYKGTTAADATLVV